MARGLFGSGETRRADAPAFGRPKWRSLAATRTPITSYGLVGSVPACGACSARTSPGLTLTGSTPKLAPPAYGAPFGALEPLLRCDAWAPRATRGVRVTGQRPQALGAHVGPRVAVFCPWIRTRALGAAPQLAPSVPSVPGTVHLGCSGHGGGTRARSDRASRPVGSRSGTRPRRRREVPPGISPPACPPCPAWAT